MSNRRKLASVRPMLRTCPKCKEPDPEDCGNFWKCRTCLFPWLKKGRKRESR